MEASRTNRPPAARDQLAHIVTLRTVPPAPAGPDRSAAQLRVSTAGTGGLEVVEVRISATQSTVQIQGELDFTNIDVVTAALARQMALGHRFVRLDLSRLTFLDYAGLRAMVDVHNDLLAANGTLVLTGVSCDVRRLLAISHLDDALFIADDADQRPPAEPTRRHLSLVSDV